jgi:hypothetical protein
MAKNVVEQRKPFSKQTSVYLGVNSLRAKQVSEHETRKGGDGQIRTEKGNRESRGWGVGGGGVESSATGNGTRMERKIRSAQSRDKREGTEKTGRERGGGVNSLRTNKIWGIGAREAVRKVYTGHKTFIY